MIDRLEELFLKYVLWIRDPMDDPDWKPVEPEDIPWDVPLDQTTAPLRRIGDSDSL